MRAPRLIGLLAASSALAAPAPPPGMVRIPGTSFVMGAGELEARGRDDLEQQVSCARAPPPLSRR